MENKKAELQNIKNIWSQFERVFNSIGWNNYGTEYLKVQREEAKEHLSMKPSHIKHGLTLSEEAKFFAVKRVCEYINGTNKPDLKEFLHINKSVFMAYALAKEFKPQLKARITNKEIDHILALDYVEMVEVTQ